MKRIGLDTSVVIRLLVGEPLDQHMAALEHIQSLQARNVKLVVADLVLLEAYFALQNSYLMPKSEAIKAMDRFLESGHFETEPGSILKSDVFRIQSKAGFGDRLIAHRYGQCADGFLTFDKAMSRLSGAHPIATSKEP
ncbi:MAG TPA: hypothetical protein PK208_10495 [Fibrobacteria bacterium]|nr:hypothetical protein [Fibrobacteria bacterium]